MKIIWEKQIGSVKIRAYEENGVTVVDATIIVNARRAVSSVEVDRSRLDIVKEMEREAIALLKSSVDALHNEMHS